MSSGVQKEFMSLFELRKGQLEKGILISLLTISLTGLAGIPGVVLILFSYFLGGGF